jgi:uncharacterized protein DUF4062
MARVYVSSTIADLKRERQAVLNWLRVARHQAIDSYLPDSETVRKSSLDDVGKCDLYVLILEHRYGFVPADGNPDGLSITQLEFRPQPAISSGEYLTHGSPSLAPTTLIL